jgi:hypothetical protein
LTAAEKLSYKRALCAYAATLPVDSPDAHKICLDCAKDVSWIGNICEGVYPVAPKWDMTAAVTLQELLMHVGASNDSLPLCHYIFKAAAPGTAIRTSAILALGLDAARTADYEELEVLVSEIPVTFSRHASTYEKSNAAYVRAQLQSLIALHKDNFGEIKRIWSAQLSNLMELPRAVWLSRVAVHDGRYQDAEKLLAKYAGEKDPATPVKVLYSLAQYKLGKTSATANSIRDAAIHLKMKNYDLEPDTKWDVEQLRSI